MSEEAAVQTFYDCLARHDGAALLDAVHNDFVLTLSPGLPLPGAREFRGGASAVGNVWGRIPAELGLRCEPDRTLPVADDEFVVLGHYRGDDWEAPFAHILTTRDGKIASLRQITDTRCWPDLKPR
jgi:ketosteroid isomerase-like protein